MRVKASKRTALDAFLSGRKAAIAACTFSENRDDISGNKCFGGSRLSLMILWHNLALSHARQQISHGKSVADKTCQGCSAGIVLRRICESDLP